MQNLTNAYRKPLRRSEDLAVGERVDVELADGDHVSVQLLEVEEETDFRHAVRSARVRVRVRDAEVWLPCANYHLPTQVAGIQMDCPITRSYCRNTSSDAWALEKDARLRFWPARSPWIEPESFVYPMKQRWFASSTQMPNEPVYVDINPGSISAPIYYHYGMDIGGVDGQDVVAACTAGIVLSRGDEAADELSSRGLRPGYDSVMVLDERGWVHGYHHLASVAPTIVVGEEVTAGTPIGTLGKEGASGGWAHLHYEIQALQPSERLASEEGYAYLWQAYADAYQPPLVAVARPHHLLAIGESAILDGSRSWARHGPLSFEWLISDGPTVEGVRVERRYEQLGTYSEILKVRDGRGNIDYDFTAVQVFDPGQGGMPVGIHAACQPTLGIEPGDKVTFAIRCFNTGQPDAVIDFGDGSPLATVKCVPQVLEGGRDHDSNGYALVAHSYRHAGHYLMSAEHVSEDGTTATARLQVRVGQDGARQHGG